MTNDGDTVYQLRRVGAAATVAGVKDLLKLSDTVTKFGRHSGNDHFLDSATLSYFVSRWHAEIQRVQQEHNDSVSQFVIRDRSLNGTYVNNRRIVGDHGLAQGDIVMFGHPYGTKIRPGDEARVIQSEFIFVFEKIKANRSNSTEAKPSHISTQRAANDISMNETILHANTSLDRGISSKTNDDIAQKRLLTNNDRPASPVLPLLGSHKVTSVSKRTTKNGGSGVKGRLKAISNISASTADMLRGLTPLNKTKQRQLKIDDIIGNSSEDEIFQLAIKSAERFGSSDSQDSLDAFTILNTGVPSSTSAMPAPSSSSSIVNSIGRVDVSGEHVLNGASNKSLLEDNTAKATSSGQRKRKRQCDVSNETSGKKRLGTQEKETKTSIDKPSANNKTRVEKHNRSSDSKTSGKKQLSVQEKETKTSNSKTSGKQQLGTQEKDNKTTNSRTSENKHSDSKTGKKRLGTQEKDKETSTGKKRLGSQEMDRFKWHDEGDHCHSFDCCQPEANKVSWVQCDDCDHWYHTQCVGCNYKSVSQVQTEFHCGCT